MTTVMARGRAAPHFLAQTRRSGTTKEAITSMRLTVLASLFALWMGGGCKPSTPPMEPVHDLPPEATGGPDAEARQIFAGRCAACHGATGGGDGVAAVALTPRPRNFHDAAWQLTTSDESIRAVILRGGAAIGKSPSMPPNPDLTDKPAVAVALVQLVRGMR